jgi:hypothetical protein
MREATELNENNEQFGKNVVVGHPAPDRTFLRAPLHGSVHK